MDTSLHSGAPATRRGSAHRRRPKLPAAMDPRYWTKRRDALREELVARINEGVDPGRLVAKFDAYLAARELAKGER